MLHATRYIAGALLTIGIAIFLYGVLVSEYNTATGIGIGTVMSAVFIFLIGLFLVASEEMIVNSRKYKKESA
jgi:hydrogenase-4 membrane subunit HyfE